MSRRACLAVNKRTLKGELLKRIMNALRRLSYRSEVVALARSLHLSGLLKGLYFRWTAPPDRVFRTKIFGIETLFYGKTPGEWRMLESLPVGEEDFLSALTSTLRPGDVFYDVGSNIGEFVLVLARVVGKQGQVIAFEPESDNYQRLREHITLNELTNVRAFRKALGEMTGKLKLIVEGFRNTQSRLVNSDMATDGDAREVEVLSGDEIRKAENLPLPQAVKIDVEGFEYSVLKGLRNSLGDPSCRLLCCEVHPTRLPAPIQSEQVLEFIGVLGFSKIERLQRGTQLHLICRKRETKHAAA